MRPRCIVLPAAPLDPTLAISYSTDGAAATATNITALAKKKKKGGPCRNPQLSGAALLFLEIIITRYGDDFQRSDNESSKWFEIFFGAATK